MIGRWHLDEKTGKWNDAYKTHMYMDGSNDS
jgi:hypothetical protein